MILQPGNNPMKSKGKRRWLIVLALVAVTITTMTFTSRNPNSMDPEMEKSAAYWLRTLPYETDDAVMIANDHPLVLAGSEIIPTLIDALDYETKIPLLDQLLPKNRYWIPAPLRNRLPERKARAEIIRQVAAFRLGLYGEKASNAVPALIAYLQKPTAYVEDKSRVIQALGFIGPEAKPAVPVLTKYLADTNTYWYFNLTSLLQIGEVPPETLSIIDWKLETVSQPHERAVLLVAAYAADAEHTQERLDILRSTLTPESTVGAHAAVAWAKLGSIPDDTKQLLRTMLDSDALSARQGAAIALAEPGDTDMQRLLHVLIEGLERGQFPTECAEALGRIGPEAAAAIPALEKDLQYVLKVKAIQALAKIRETQRMYGKFEMANVVAIELDEDQPESGERVDFVITNNGKQAIQFPDTWYVLFADGSYKMLSIPLYGDFRLAPGDSENLPIATPKTTLPWKLGTSFIEEDITYEAAVAIGTSPVGDKLPSTFTHVRGRNDISDWIEPLKQ